MGLAVIQRLGEDQCGEEVGLPSGYWKVAQHSQSGSLRTRTISAASGCIPQRNPPTGPSGDMYVDIFVHICGDEGQHECPSWKNGLVSVRPHPRVQVAFRTNN